MSQGSKPTQSGQLKNPARTKQHETSTQESKVQDKEFNRDAHFSSDSDEWATPIELVRQLRRGVGGEFDLDAASGCEPSPIAKNRYTEAENGLSQPWFGKTYCNPPYSGMEDWAEKAATEAADPAGPELVVMLIPARTSTQWFHNHILQADYLCLIERRLKFYGAENSAPFPSALVVFDGTLDDDGVPDSLLHVLEHRGAVYAREEIEGNEQVRFDQLFDTGPANRSEPEISHGEPPLAGISVGDDLRLDLDDSTIGFPTGVDATPTVRVVGGDRVGDIQEFLAVADHGPEGSTALETYYALSYGSSSPHDVRCSVCADGNAGWQDVILQAIEVVRQLPGGRRPERAVA